MIRPAINTTTTMITVATLGEILFDISTITSSYSEYVRAKLEDGIIVSISKQYNEAFSIIISLTDYCQGDMHTSGEYFLFR